MTQQTLAQTAQCDGVGERGDPWVLFRRVMMNAFIDRVRLRKRETNLEEPAHNGRGEDVVDSGLNRIMVRQALARLEPDQVRMLYLVYGEGYSLEEAGARLGMTEEAVKQRLKRVRARLRSAFPEMNQEARK